MGSSKYRPEFPERFGSLGDARTDCQGFFHWYNHEHRHSGIGLMTPHAVHYGIAEALHQQRARTLQLAHDAQPLRFKGRLPQPPALPTADWINPPKQGDHDHRSPQHPLAKFIQPGVSG